MDRKNIEDRSPKDIDTYLSNNERDIKLKCEEYNEFLELEKQLSDTDFSKDSNREAVFNKVLKNIEEYKGDDDMKRLNKYKRLTTVAVSITLACVVSISLTQTSFGQDLVDRVIRTISLGHIKAVELEKPKGDFIPIPEEFKGKVFDEDGNMLEKVSKEYKGKFYAEDGEEITTVEGGKIITLNEYKRARKDKVISVTNSNELNEYTCFNVILPSYLPEGYEFDRAEFYKDEEGNVKDTKYIDMYFKNGDKEIFMQQRFASEETGYEMGIDNTAEKIKVNNLEAIVSDDSIDWEYNNVLYGIIGKEEEITKKELIKIAESIMR